METLLQRSFRRKPVTAMADERSTVRYYAYGIRHSRLNKSSSPSKELT